MQINLFCKVWHLQPWFAKDLAIRSLANRLRDLANLTHVFPDVPKDDAFAAWYTQVGLRCP